jgi:hypothetical protein
VCLPAPAARARGSCARAARTARFATHHHLPPHTRARWQLALAAQLAAGDPPVRFVWTAHAWLLSLFLDCPSHIGVACPSAAQQARLRDAMAAGVCVCSGGARACVWLLRCTRAQHPRHPQRAPAPHTTHPTTQPPNHTPPPKKQGVVTWHAVPFNLQWELLGGPAALRAALAVGQQLDAALRLPRKSVVSLVRRARPRRGVTLQRARADVSAARTTHTHTQNACTVTPPPVTRHTSHITRHTSHVTRPPPPALAA